jgi:diguanylate cyclase (GGDEF)-like protein
VSGAELDARADLPAAPAASPVGDGACAVLDRAALGVAMPMHLLSDGGGRVVSVGPTLGKLLDGGAEAVLGRPLLEVVRLRRPANMATPADLLAHSGAKLRVEMPLTEPTRLVGVVVPAGDGILMKLSPGIGIVDAVARHRLTISDFAPTDLAVELLYLVEAVDAAMSEARTLNSRLEDARIRAQEAAFTDALTGLRNRRALDHLLGRLVATETPFALMNVDLDRFKAVNDTHGHAAGDHVLAAAAEHMSHAARRDDVVARTGGDEFVLILRGSVAPERLMRIAKDLITAIERPVTVPPEAGGATCEISASIGIALSTSYDRPDAERMARDADDALYESKRAGRGRARIHGID